MRSLPYPTQRVRVAVASPDQRVAILQICADIYAASDSPASSPSPWNLAPVLDQQSTYLIATRGQEVLGFIGITPPTSPRYALETYLPREQLPVPTENMYELRLLTVARAHQHSRLAALLMYAAFRWVGARGGARIVAVSRRDKLDMFTHVGLRPIVSALHTGAGEMVVLSATLEEMRQTQQPLDRFIQRLETAVEWDPEILHAAD